MKGALLILISLSIWLNSEAQSDDLLLLSNWIRGSFDSNEQHLKDTVNYYDIHLEIIPVWKNRKDGFWYYVEQAMAGFLDKPYRQRIYHLTEPTAGVFESKVYTLRDPLRFTHHPELIESLNTDSITEKEGCSVFLKKTDDKNFRGSTNGKDCPSDRKGAAYATSEVSISEQMLESWDRGYDENGEQVWGAELGPYRFIKKQK